MHQESQNLDNSITNVLVVLRHDANYRPGGDTTLLSLLSRNLIDCKCTIQVGIPNNVKKFDVVICANIDRPIEANELLKVCQRDQVPLHLMSLHHSYSDISKFLKYGLQGWKRVLALLSGFSPVIYEQFLWTLRVFVSYFSKAPILNFGNVSRSQLELLNGCELLLVVSKDEQKMIEHDIGSIHCRVAFVPHIIGEKPIEKCKEKNIIFCPGRVESRKNQLFLLEVAKYLQEFNFVFMGRLNVSEPSYCKKFMKSISSLKNVSYLEPAELEDFRVYLMSSKIVLTSSWFEVTSLIELEVLKSGNKLVTGSPSYNNSFFSNPLVFENNDFDGCVMMIKKAFEENDIKILGEYPDSNSIVKGYLDSI